MEILNAIFLAVSHNIFLVLFSLGIIFNAKKITIGVVNSIANFFYPGFGNRTISSFEEELKSGDTIEIGRRTTLEKVIADYRSGIDSLSKALRASVIIFTLFFVLSSFINVPLYINKLDTRNNIEYNPPEIDVTDSKEFIENVDRNGVFENRLEKENN